MAKMMNPPKKKKIINTKQKREPFDFKKHKRAIIIISSALLILAMAVSALAIFLNWYFVDTPYDSPFFKSYVTVPDYKGLVLSRAEIDKEFEQQKKALLRENATFTERTEGVINEGDNVTINGAGYVVVNGVKSSSPFYGSELEAYEITDVGNHITKSGTKFFPEIQEAIIGKKAKGAGVIEVEMKYDDNYSIESLRGKTVIFDITVTKVTKPEYPEYTDEYVKKAAGFETIAEYESKLYATIEKEALWTKLALSSEIKKYPKSKIKKYSKDFDEYYEQQMQKEGLTFKELLKKLETDEEGYEALKLQYAKGVIKEELILYTVVKSEKIRVSRAQYKEEALKLAEQNGYESLKDFEASYGKEVVRRTILWEKVKSMLVENATITD